ncbi:hypothetical protein ACWYXK_08755 [Janthinobacterium lividum]|jgi:hypothetical protein|uniref:hypothetical protein n=1 Tax=Janthinobacterium TaxID=29580 RepID=UPI00087F5C33|nr:MULTISPECIES: hypothetical protein [Janthinobacterium]MCC7696828.1 hypothetical protein [Janthinobacterium sp. EB271-G4-7A]MCC7712270.1 hypothetical protein [Janthinobacterium lividum]OEZ54915.1 hypothetical protein JANLI_34790 [Janthinobacterium lividum]WQE27054.1 hypothetical protein U0004_18845 [Janthinobacterium lividum]SDG80305.1 hypothetical protein SAMN05428968_0989 [Janthinobacterium sp. YR213]
MTVTAQPTKLNSLQWMRNVGITEKDIAWLESVRESEEIYNPTVLEQFEALYQKAVTGLLNSPSPVQTFLTL